MNKPTYEELEAQVKQLAAENAALKAAFTPEEISTGATDVFSDTAILKIDGDEFHSSQWVDNETDVIRAVLDFFKPETTATDAILDSLRAEGVDGGIERIMVHTNHQHAGVAQALHILRMYAAQLRSKPEV